ncbi:MAG: DUF4349 domain-containing protein [Clostridiales bacterium]|jgi:hypothetical protein|nr:DUF4349 domain-containing protein [Clostridiales bacterium]
MINFPKTKRWMAAGAILLTALAGCSSLKSSQSPSTAPSLSQNTGGGLFDAAESGEIREEMAYDAAASADYDGGAASVEAPQYAEPVSAPMPDAADWGGTSNAGQPAKIIQSGNVSLNTKKFDETCENIKSLTNDCGGYMENAQLYTEPEDRYRQAYRVYNVTLRVPADQFTAVKRQAESLGELINSHESAKNVSGEYYNLSDRLQTKTIQEERLLSMIDRSEQVDDLLALEQRLGQIRADVERFKTRMNQIDQLSSYATLSIYLQETPVAQIAPPKNLSGRIQESFIQSVNRTAESLENMVVVLAGMAAPLCLIAVLAASGYGIAVYLRKKKTRYEQS